MEATMGAMEQLEEKLNEVFVRKAPYQLPEKAKHVIVNILPWINLIFGVLTLLTAYSLYQAATVVDKWVDWSNQLSKTYGGTATVVTNHLTLMVWLGIIVLAVEGILWIAAFPGVKDRKKTGWNLLFIALLVNIVYGFMSLFISVGTSSGITGFLGYAIGTAIGLYFLFQIRSQFLDKTAVTHKAAKPKKAI
jgi:hypothetical protein